ncbi:RNAse Z [Methanococcus maripaludis C5]|uniref:Ribonuclease Z n=1 Tax=Methanococcus maripaludis (strain C5 / ATCC BAA-1333) TaxID=402880 RepID=RNZ_METM5|nr:ribonuclease Z [Methanococcus maripaludis]A4FXT9.1 RecName: Full=Ribonuclease Z; Short=RNase Z; AltName: Full=tRNA 3 endonuclease; AltName: Full=tRNase Z [Methanococcus maripaludis C5]ABO35023.1 RNAse Z [Methanococcus maripaludis C5]
MKLTFLGTGAAIPTKYRAHPSISLKFDGEIFLFDCGENTQRQIIFTDVSPMKINNIFISHLHGDHVLGIPGLLQSIAFQGRTKPLNIYGPEETAKMIKNILNVGYHSIDYPINVYEISSKTSEKIISTDNYDVFSFPVVHSVPAVAYVFRQVKKPRMDLEKVNKLGIEIGPDLKRLKDGYNVELNGKIITPEDVTLPPKKGICVGYSGDTIPLNEFADFLKELKCTILIHEATFDKTMDKNAKETLHSTVHDALNIAKRSGANTVILTHISARYDELSAFEKDVVEFKVEHPDLHVLIAEDLMEYSLKGKWVKM